MPMGKKEARILHAIAEEALSASKMERANLGSHVNTEEIKEATRLYRQSWITHPLQQIVTALKNHM